MTEKQDADKLISALHETSEALEHGEKLYRDLKTGARRMRIMLWVAMIGLVLDLTLSAAFGFILNGQHHLNSRISQNQANIKTVECDLNTLFIGADTAAARNASPNKAQYDAQFHVIYQNRIQLGCQPPIAEPART